MTTHSNRPPEARPHLWDYACGLYAKPDVKNMCLELQNQHHANVLVVLWLCWLEAFNIQPANEQAQHHITRIFKESHLRLQQLRQTREPLTCLNPENNNTLKQQILSAELTIEKAVLEALEATCTYSHAPKTNTQDTTLTHYLNSLQPTVPPNMSARLKQLITPQL